MKLLTLNCHSLLSPAYSRDCENFVREVLRLRPDLIALQEVNQTRTASPAAGDLAGWTPPAAGALLRADNHALRVARMLQEAGWPVHWTWTFAKIGYGRYEEGLALLSPGPLAQAEDWFITRSRDPENWKVRKALSARVALDGRPARCICVHMGWWGEEEEPFPAQWEQVEAGARQGEPCLVLGDLNAPAAERGGGYDFVTGRGWQDAWALARQQEGEGSIPGVIAGWEDRLVQPVMRIDHILTDTPLEVARAAIVLDGRDGPAVSDHYGVLVTAKWRKTT